MIRYTAYAISLAANKVGIYFKQTNDLLEELKKTVSYNEEELERLERLYDKSVKRGDEEISDHILQLTAEIQEKIVKENQ